MAELRPLVAGNWKMNGLLADGPDRARDLLTLVERKGAPHSLSQRPERAKREWLSRATTDTRFASC
jgi:hypothetical protein